jgi:hypothetical protein
MVRPDLKKRDQNVEDMRRLSLEAPHPRSRERFQAMYMIDSGQKNQVNKRCWIGCINTMSRGQTVSTISLVGDGRPNSMEPKKKDH